MFQSISQAGTCSSHLAVQAFVPAEGELPPSLSGLSLLPPFLQPVQAASKPQTHLWPELIQKWHLSICSLLRFSLPRCAPVGGERESSSQSGEPQKAQQRCGGHSGPGWLQFPRGPSQHCFLGLQVKWEKLISWFGVCAFSMRHSFDQSHSVLWFDLHFHTSSCMARSSTHEFRQTAVMEVNKSKEK